MVKFNGYDVVKLEVPTVSFGGVSSYSLSEAPEEIQSLEHGYYSVNGQEFKIDRNKYRNNIYFPIFTKQGKHVIELWISDKWEQAHLAEEKKQKEAMDIWNADLETELQFDEDGKALLKPWKGKEIYLMKSDECDYELEEGENVYEVFVDGRAYCDLFESKKEDGTVEYQCYDGEPYKRADKPKKAIENMLKDCFRSSDDYEPSCSSCGDGGCPSCEPHRFVEGYIY